MSTLRSNGGFPLCRLGIAPMYLLLLLLVFPGPINALLLRVSNQDWMLDDDPVPSTMLASRIWDSILVEEVTQKLVIQMWQLVELRLSKLIRDSQSHAATEACELFKANFERFRTDVVYYKQFCGHTLMTSALELMIQVDKLDKDTAGSSKNDGRTSSHTTTTTPTTSTTSCETMRSNNDNNHSVPVRFGASKAVHNGDLMQYVRDLFVHNLYCHYHVNGMQRSLKGLLPSARPCFDDLNRETLADLVTIV